MSKSDFWLARTYYCCSTAVTAMIALFDATSRHAQIFRADGMDGRVAIAALLFLTLVGLMDVLLDEFMHYEDRAYRRLKRNRFMLFMAMSAAHLSLLVVATQTFIVEPFLSRYAVDALFGVVIASLLVFRRYKTHTSTLL